MTVSDLLEKAQFLIDKSGNKQAVVLDYAIWEEFLALLEDLEDAEEIRRLRESNEDVISWEEALAELRAEGVDV